MTTTSTTTVDKIYGICRKTQKFRPIALYPQVSQILQFCLDHDLILTICSRSPQSTVIEQVLKQFGIWEYFLFPQIYNERKSYHFRNFNDVSGHALKDILFFDDEPANINVVSSLGVSGCLVSKEQGLDWSTFVKGIALFATKQRTSKSLKSWLGSSTATSISSNIIVAEEGRSRRNERESRKDSSVVEDEGLKIERERSRDDDDDEVQIIYYSRDHR
jgi:hypothetical protein